MTHRALISVRFDGGDNPESVAAMLVAALEDFQVVAEADVSVVDDPIASRRAPLLELRDTMEAEFTRFNELAEEARLAKVADRIRAGRKPSERLLQLVTSDPDAPIAYG